jgi:sugar (pentulose or hexulose) kinase
VTEPGAVLLSCGTAWVVLVALDDPAAAFRSGMAVGPHVRDGLWGAIRSLGGLGASMEWLLDMVWGDAAGAGRAARYAELNEAAARSAPGAGGLLCFPLAGGHASGFGPAPGGFLRLSLGHTRGDLVRAVMEGAAFELRWMLEQLAESDTGVAELRMVGGAARSPVWPQIIADVIALPVVLPAMHDAACAGAAILAGVAAGCFSDPAAGYAAFGSSEKRLRPDPALRSLYDAAFADYRHWRSLALRSTDRLRDQH